MISVLKPKLVRSYDADAATYISAVETADAQTLELPIKEAINEFVINCKITGIWSAIQSCVLLCGPRTQSGAVVPLKGTAPTLTSFIGDYNRETGLLRTSGTFATGRFGNSDDQNSKHVAVFPSFIDLGSSVSNSRSLIANNSTSGGTILTATSLGINARVNSASNVLTNQRVFANNMIGVSVQDSSNAQVLYNSIVNSATNITTTPDSAQIILYGGGGLTSSSSRIAFYSIGSNLDLQILERLLKIYLYKISRYLDSTYSILDTDAAAYVSNVKTLNGVNTMGYTYNKAINDFVAGCKTDGTWSAIKAACILCGSNRLAGALYPLVGTAPTNVGFVDGDYDPNLGLSNNALTGTRSRSSFIRTNRGNADDPQNDQHLSIFVAIPESLTTESTYIGVGSNDTGATQIQTNINRRSRNGLNAVNGGIPNKNTFVGISRSSSSNFTTRTNNSTSSWNVVSETPNTAVLSVFCRQSFANFTDATLSYYSIGTSLNLALYDTRVTTLISQLSSVRSV